MGTRGMKLGRRATSRPSLHFPAKSAWVSPRGYVLMYWPEHPAAMGKPTVSEHVAIVYRVMRKLVPKGTEIHHADRDRTNNQPSNLVVCQDLAYHKLLHARLDAYEACGHANWRRCGICKQYGDPANVRPVSLRQSAGHRHVACHAKQERERVRLRGRPSKARARHMATISLPHFVPLESQ